MIEKASEDQDRPENENKNNKLKINMLYTDDQDDTKDTPADLDSDNLSYTESFKNEGGRVKGSKKENQLNCPTELSLVKTKQFYNSNTCLDKIAAMRKKDSSLEILEKYLMEEFVNSGLESFSCESINSATDTNSMYKVENLSESHPDYLIIYEAVCKSIVIRWQPTLSFLRQIKNKFKVSKIHRIISNRNDALQRASGNKLLFHGTRPYSIINILNKGFIPSKTGNYGRGVYLTNGSAYALSYSIKENINSCYVFVVEVLSSNQLVIGDKSCVTSNNFTKFEKSLLRTEEVLLYDSKKCSICKGLKFSRCGDGITEPKDIFVAHQDGVVPAYLIKFEM